MTERVSLLEARVASRSVLLCYVAGGLINR